MAPEEPEILDDRSFPVFRAKMDAAVQAGKNSTKAMKDKKKKARIVQKSSWCAQLKRAQCYLGVRPRGTTANKEEFHADPNATWEDSKEAQQAYEKAAGLILPDLDPAEAAPYEFDQSVVFVCVDVEAYERDQKKITEVGISTLDTLDIIKIPPGEGGIEWMKHIRARHFRIVETSHLRNREIYTRLCRKFPGAVWKQRMDLNQRSPAGNCCMLSPTFLNTWKVYISSSRHAECSQIRL